MFTIANFKPVGSRPIDKQKQTICVAGNANTKYIKATLPQICEKCFCNRARTFPLEVILKNQSKKVRNFYEQSERNLRYSNKSSSSRQTNLHYLLTQSIY